MSNKKFIVRLMAFVAMSLITLPSFSQTKPFSPKFKTPNTSSELKERDEADAHSAEVEDRSTFYRQSDNQRKLQRHGLGLGVGQTFLLGNYAKHGKDKITLDLLYTYAASYSFDLLLDAHMSEHEDENEILRTMGFNGSIKGRFVEYDNLSPYFLGGLGFYAPRAKRRTDTGMKWTDQKLTFGLNFGGGVDLRLNDRYVVGVMGQMHWPFKIQQDNQSDLKGYYFKLLITGMYLF